MYHYRYPVGGWLNGRGAGLGDKNLDGHKSEQKEEYRFHEGALVVEWAFVRHRFG
ncbi:hypothetical protein GCM10022408_06960 [Hymenobacter fastidiosus]|uniref:Uncharacterized protein n=1 Tax=Hymenobacter fastidiosus TaxID=486264 RepID=A0ABP7RKF4_9BACT